MAEFGFRSPSGSAASTTTSERLEPSGEGETLRTAPENRRSPKSWTRMAINAPGASAPASWAVASIFTRANPLFGAMTKSAGLLPASTRVPGAHRREHLIYAPELGLRARRHDDADGAPRHDERAREGHVFTIADGGVLGDRIIRFIRRDRFPGESGFVGAQILHLNEAQVRRHAVAGLKQHNITRDQLVGGRDANFAVSLDASVGRKHASDRIQRFLGSAFLKESENGVDDDDARNDRRVEPKPEHELHEAGGEQDIDEDVVELLQETQ